jgi:hypothetical protein
MGRINTARVVSGGLVAGLIINISEAVLNLQVLAADLEAATTAHNLAPMGGNAIAIFTILGFVLGVALVWLYAAIRPRYGPGPRTAICAALTVWFLAYCFATINFAVLGLMPTGPLVIGLVWGLVELIVAALAGCRLYQEPA